MTPPHKRLAMVACVGLLAACQRAGPDEQPQPADGRTEPEPPVLTVGEPPLDREGMLLAVARAASDFALGRDDGARQRALDGRSFALHLRFGCDGDADRTRQWTYDDSAGVLRIRVEPEITARTPLVADQRLEAYEAAEGFWIRRPWLLEAACPVEPAAGAGTAAPAPEDRQGRPEPAEAGADFRVGIAQFFTAQDSRASRRDNRAYEAAVQLAAGETPGTDGYDLVLSGRLARLANGRTISCVATGADAPPACIVAVELDRVSLARPDGETVADWS